MVGILTTALTSANEKYWAVVHEAQRLFDRVKHLFPNSTFWKWAEISYSPLGAAFKVIKLAQTELNQAIQRFYGPNYGEFSTYVDNVTNAQSIIPFNG